MSRKCLGSVSEVSLSFMESYSDVSEPALPSTCGRSFRVNASHSYRWLHSTRRPPPALASCRRAPAAATGGRAPAGRTKCLGSVSQASRKCLCSEVSRRRLRSVSEGSRKCLRSVSEVSGRAPLWPAPPRLSQAQAVRAGTTCPPRPAPPAERAAAGEGATRAVVAGRAPAPMRRSGSEWPRWFGAARAAVVGEERAAREAARFVGEGGAGGRCDGRAGGRGPASGRLCELGLLLGALGRGRHLSVGLADLGEVALHVGDGLLEHLLRVLHRAQRLVHVRLDKPDEAITKVHRRCGARRRRGARRRARASGPRSEGARRLRRDGWTCMGHVRGGRGCCQHTEREESVYHAEVGVAAKRIFSPVGRPHGYSIVLSAQRGG